MTRQLFNRPRPGNPACQLNKPPPRRQARLLQTAILLAVLASTAQATPVITMATSLPPFASGPAAFFQTLTVSSDGSFQSQLPEQTMATERAVNALIGLDAAGQWHPHASPGASVFVGGAASPVRLPAEASQAAVPVPRHPPAPLASEVRPGASVFVGRKPDGVVLSFALFQASSRPVMRTLGHAAIEIFPVGQEAVALSLTAVGVTGALSSSLMVFVGSANGSDAGPDSAP